LKRKLNKVKKAFLKKQNSEPHHTARDAGMETGVNLQEAYSASKSVTEVFTADLGECGQDSKRFTGMNVSDLLFLEIFAGTARLSKVARDVGFQILPIDKTNARASQIFVAQYDLANPDDVEALVELIKTERHRILAIHLAPACGTASRAREKKLSSLAKHGFKIPVPLRSRDKPMGLDGLQGLDKVRTESANLVYSATAVIVRLCMELHILCSVENPANSLFWFFPDIAALLDTRGIVWIFTTACMEAPGTSSRHGGLHKMFLAS
jgi:hypothetical protein